MSHSFLPIHFKPHESIESEHIHLSAKFIITHLLNQLNHFPFGLAGPTRIVSSVNETSDTGLNLDELSTILFEQSNIQFFTVNNRFLISFIELSMKANEKFFNINPKLKTSTTVCRFIVRDFCGKNCWDCCMLHAPDENLPLNYLLDMPPQNPPPAKLDLDSSNGSDSSPGLVKEAEFDFTKLTHMGKDEIPKDIDILDNILKYISHSSPECRLDGGKKALNIVWDLQANLNVVLNAEDMRQKIVSQSTQENKFAQAQHDAEIKLLQSKRNSSGELKPTPPAESGAHTPGLG